MACQVVARPLKTDCRINLTKKLPRSRFMSDTFYNFAAVWLLHVMKYEEKSHFEKGLIDN